MWTVKCTPSSLASPYSYTIYEPDAASSGTSSSCAARAAIEYSLTEKRIAVLSASVRFGAISCE